MHMIYIDADACPVKSEVYKVAARYTFRVKIVANSTMKVPASDRIELIVCSGFGAADDWIAEQVGPGDIVITADIPLAARCLDKDAHVLGPKGNEFEEKDIGSVLATRDLLEDLRQSGAATGGPAPMKPKDRSRFLSKLDNLIHAVLKKHPRRSLPDA